jgi:hypothetical protein
MLQLHYPRPLIISSEEDKVVQRLKHQPIHLPAHLRKSGVLILVW